MSAIITGDCRTILATIPDASVDSCVTDPPYELGFMGRAWDSSGIAYDADVWREVLRVLKPGGHVLAFGGSRTYHRMAVAIEDAGFEIRDSLMWLTGQGFPKSLDVSKAIDKAAGAEREVLGVAGRSGSIRNAMAGDFAGGDYYATAPATDAARQWSGWGTALKPAFEPLVLARKPLIGTVAANVLAHGTGALNVDGCRIGTGEGGKRDGEESAARRYADRGATDFAPTPGPRGGDARGRWPANVILDEEAAAMLDEQSGERGAAAPASGPSLTGPTPVGRAFGARNGTNRPPAFHADKGGASRFFYCAKASSSERDAGLDAFPVLSGGDATGRKDDSAGTKSPRAGAGRGGGRRNPHPTVKPIELMRWLVRLVTPPGGTVLDPFAGSGTTGCAAALEGFDFIGCELLPAHVAVAEARIAYWKAKAEDLRGEIEKERQLGLFGGAA